MTPTPPAHSTFQDGSSFRYAGRRRPVHRNPYDTSHHTPPNPQTSITPLPDNGVELETLSDVDVDVDVEDEDEGEEIVDEEEIEGEENDVDADEEDEEEGGIEEGRTMPPRSQQSGRAPTRPGTYTWEPPPPIPPVFDEVVNPRYRLPQRGRSITPPVNHYGAWFREGFGQVQQVVEEGPPGRSETPLIETSPVERRSWYQEVVNEAPPPVPMDVDPPFDATALGLKEIGNLASWTVSSCKPGCGVEALRDEDIGQFWQSDGPQPHHLNIHFSRLVSIRSIRIYLDFEADESYTPTKITLFAGTGYHDLIPFSALEFTQPKGWIDVPLEHVGGGRDGKTLRAFLVQVKVIENHQNGKDTHVRGLKVYARDERVGRGVTDVLGGEEEVRKSKAVVRKSEKADGGFLMEPDWMGEPELR